MTVDLQDGIEIFYEFFLFKHYLEEKSNFVLRYFIGKFDSRVKFVSFVERENVKAQLAQIFVQQQQQQQQVLFISD